MDLWFADRYFLLSYLHGCGQAFPPIVCINLHTRCGHSSSFVFGTSVVLKINLVQVVVDVIMSSQFIEKSI